MRKLVPFIALFFIIFSFLQSEEIPKPTYDNSLSLSVTHTYLAEDASEINYIKDLFGDGLYTNLLFSSFYNVDMAWNANINSIGNSIDSFKTRVDRMITFAKTYKVGIHITLNYGLARKTTLYSDSKIEDIRNAQWYNDNNFSSSAQQSRTGADASTEGGSATNLNLVEEYENGADINAADSVINKYVAGTLSRYARKVRAHLNAKVTAGFAYLVQVQNANPDVHLIISAPGETELNYYRINDSVYMQDYFCDYSPFAIAEFRDWIRHEGLYASGSTYAGEGYASGGSRYQGTSGLSNFNSDFGTSFTSWDLKYYNWSLSDALDTDYTDASNPDPNIIPVSQYSYGGMMPTSGSKYISGGFDAPRVMQEPGAGAYYDLWETFRQELVGNFVKDMADIARSGGFTKSKYYTHQIPGDYLFNTRPNDPAIPMLNPRYYSSASPLSTADAYSDIGLGITVYDINFGTWFARTSLYSVEAANVLSDNWAALEYNPEVIPTSISATLSSVSVLYDEILRLYNSNPHLISLYQWEGSEYVFKGTNRETAAKQFFDAVKNKARQSITTVFTPKTVDSLTGSYANGVVTLNWSNQIWSDLTHVWSDWGDFKEFAVYRGYSSGFTANAASRIAVKSINSHQDSGYTPGTTVYYKVAAVNASDVAGPTRTVSVVVPGGTFEPVLGVSRSSMNYAYTTGGAGSQSQKFSISNTGTGAVNWTITDDAAWLTCDPTSGVNAALVTVSADGTGLAEGSYTGTITVADPASANSPQTITVTLTVKSTAQDIPPIGQFATPGEGDSVSSSVPVTGWAVDDVGLESVKIYREDAGSLAYIGDALFVEGARDDIAALYPDYPASYQAGWGYMLLSHFLPNGGNGTYTLHAIATDTAGQQTTLGTKTFTCNNADAVKPFGAIDTPSQGGMASGSSFKNQGWVLTPMPGQMPTDGSTIDVYVDGVNLGHPAYNKNRPDIASLFPTYANKDGAGGTFVLDTTAYENGVYTIAWIAADNLGNSDGIGSRFFQVQNNGSVHNGSANSRRTSVREKETLSQLPLDNRGPVSVSKGYNGRQKRVRPGKSGMVTVESRECERVVISFFNESTAGEAGKVNSRVRNISDLPIGSTLNADTGMFYWLPGPGFVGQYEFDFAISDGGKAMKRKRVKINIRP
ncbi:MAG: BACON domain-containing protein, partial [bacterium]|nr:BACON domain-containing protein [bacterium]